VSLVEYTVDGAVAVLTLNRPPVNALSSALAADLGAAVAQAADPAVRAVVVTGSPHFAAGADITELQAAAAGDDKALASDLLRALNALESLRKPVIAAVRGFALGGGLELALACDFRYLAEDARVGVPEIKLGIYPGAGGTQRLPRLIGLARARDLIYTGRHVRADEALAIGLADRVVRTEELAGVAMQAAQGLAGGATVAIGAAKRAINGGAGRALKKGLEMEAEGFLQCLATEDAREGLAAFLEKREAVFKGR
jgi:enoyl-CoA hydratase/carnithine racemase